MLKYCCPTQYHYANSLYLGMLVIAETMYYSIPVNSFGYFPGFCDAALILP